MILHQISSGISKKMVKNAVISSSQETVCTYGMELLLSSGMGVAALIVVSCVFDVPFLWIPYLAGFVPLRISGGGLHANTHQGCLLIFTSAYTVLLLACPWFMSIRMYPFLTSTITMSIICCISPVEAMNKPLKPEKRMKNRKKSICLGVGNLLLSIVVSKFCLTNSRWITMYFTGYGLAGISMVIAVGINLIERRKRQ